MQPSVIYEATNQNGRRRLAVGVFAGKWKRLCKEIGLSLQIDRNIAAKKPKHCRIIAHLR